jgi:hypothetical protein
VRAVERTLVATLPDADEPNPGNPIHSTDTARDYGFRAALVGGATIYGWCTGAIIEAAGMEWLDRGWAHVSFRRPVFPNDELRVRIAADGEIEVRSADDRIRIDGRIGLGAAPWPAVVAPVRKAPEPPPDPLPALTPDNVPVGEDLRARRVRLSRADADTFCREKQSEMLACFYGDDARVHPAWLANQPIYWLHHSFAYGPAIHTESRIEHVRGARVGQDFTVLGRCADAFERNGHCYIVNDTEIVDAADELVARIRHTAIFQVAKTRGEGT